MPRRVSSSIAAARAAPGWPVLYFAVWGVGVLLLALWAVLALLDPARGPHDRLAGTYLVPD